ncbi:LuxR C-terminal-related transcriptional regulator [Kribbella shirazensis]|uniref:Putative ATPase n=1 Tax=Kribbella shirazensis TaxID=1105143 RepID=A0A7X5V4A2_9ACTN|nr:putative ATPase [Kribbella shirazensis]
MTEPSGREAEVLAAIGAGLSNARIASRLHISIRTVEGHVSSLLRKYGVSSRSELAALSGTGAAGGAPTPGMIIGLPPARTSFVGRVRERAELLDLLASARLVTLLGPGGIGKTRLATVVAEAAGPTYPFGGVFVDLVPAQDGSVPQAVAAALEVAESPGKSLEAAIIGRLERGPFLLVLDNCEHVVDGVAAFADAVLAASPGTTILATSRERLAIPGEQTYHLGPLPLDSDAEQLFADRAAAVGPDDATDPAVVAELCARLDGLPLAIELAAARRRAMGELGLVVGLGDSLRLLAGGRGSTVRHRSLRSVIGWSHDLLDADEQRLLRRLGVFAGGFDLAAVAAVAELESASAADLLGRLADQSLLIPAQAGGQWRMLATIRAYAVEQLRASRDYADTLARHRQWAISVADDLRDRLDGHWESDFDAVADDLRAALATDDADGKLLTHRLARGLGCLTFARRFFAEAEQHYLAAAECAPTAAEALLDSRNAAAAALKVSGRTQASQHLLAAAERAGDDANVRAQALALSVSLMHRYGAEHTEVTADRTSALLATARGLFDGAGDPTTRAMIEAARAWNAAPDLTHPAPDTGLARVAVDAARDAGDPVLLLGALDALGGAVAGEGRLAEAHLISQQRLPLLAEIPRHEPYAEIEVVDALLMAATHAVGAADYAAVLAGSYPFMEASKVLALSCTGRFAEATGIAESEWENWIRNGSPPLRWMSPQAAAAALVHGLLGHPKEEENWRARALEIARVTDAAEVPHLAAIDAYVDARLAIHRGSAADVEDLVRRAVADLPEPWYAPYAKVAGVELAVVAGLPTAADLLGAAGSVRTTSDWAAAGILRAEGRLTGDLSAYTEAADLYDGIGARFERACTLLLLPDRAAEGRAEMVALGATIAVDWSAGIHWPARCHNQTGPR